MRRFCTLVLCLVLLLWGLFPTVPTYVCLGMGGAHRVTPCCPGADVDEVEGAAVGSRCCEGAEALSRLVALPGKTSGQDLLGMPLLGDFAAVLRFGAGFPPAEAAVHPFQRGRPPPGVSTSTPLHRATRLRI